MGRTIGIVSLKGGVGKTSSAIALGHAMASFGKKVLLVDANLSAPNLGIHLDIFSPDKGLHEVLRRDSNPSEAVFSLDNFDVLPTAVFNNKNVSPLKLRDRLKHLKRSYDVIIIDSSPALNDETLAAILASDEILVVTTPDAPTLGVTMKAVKLAKQRGTNISGLILNKVHGKNFEIPLKHVEEVLELPVMASVPNDINFLKALSEFKPLTEHSRNSEASQEYYRLAAALLGEKHKQKKLKRFFRWLNPRKQDINRLIFYEELFKG